MVEPLVMREVRVMLTERVIETRLSDNAHIVAAVASVLSSVPG